MQICEKTVVASLRERGGEIAEGDVLLFRRRSVISIAGRGIHSHAAKAVCRFTPPSRMRNASGRLPLTSPKTAPPLDHGPLTAALLVSRPPAGRSSLYPTIAHVRSFG